MRRIGRERDSRTTVEPMENDAPCVMGAHRPPVAVTGMAGDLAAVNRPLVASATAKLLKYSGATPQEPYLAQSRLAEWHNSWGVGEAVIHQPSSAAQVLLDLDPGPLESLGSTLLTRRSYPDFPVGVH